MTATTIALDRIDTPIGPMLLMVRDTSVVLLEFADKSERYLAHCRRRLGPHEIVETINPVGYSDRIRAYFTGALDAVDSIPTAGSGTPFQERVWAELRRIKCGKTLSYGALAERLGDKNAMRAVGFANGSNPISIIVPCHRVIGADGRLTGYGGGLDRKAWLLEHEGVPLRDGRVASQADLFRTLHLAPRATALSPVIPANRSADDADTRR